MHRRGIDADRREESISSVKPTGWVNEKYDSVDGGYLYNRCHLIGYQLSGENANEENLITGTRYMNVEGMLPFEDMVADYVHETDNHVMYRVTPVFEGDDLVASGVQMEAESVEDDGEGVSFNVYVYNVQPISRSTTPPEKTGRHRRTRRLEILLPGIPPDSRRISSIQIRVNFICRIVPGQRI